MANDIHYIGKLGYSLVWKLHYTKDKTLMFIYWIFYYEASSKWCVVFRPFGADFLIGRVLIAGQTVIL